MKKVLAILALCASSAMAQDVAWDAASSEACLMHTGNDERCFGLSATICIEAGGNMSALGMEGCIQAEHDYWSERLLAVQKAYAKAAPTLAENLQTLEAAWVQLRDAKCDLAADKYFDAAFARIAKTQCAMKETARQALFLEASISER
jgi:uncharacterized protein YecT (DUF1311 family)